MTPLRQRMIEDMQLRNFSSHTQKAYALQVALFAWHFDQSPDFFGPENIRSYQLSTAHVESVINHLVNHRLSKKQQMRWSPEGAHYLLQVRAELLNGTLLDGYRLANPQFQDLLDSAMQPEPPHAPTYVPLPLSNDIHTADVVLIALHGVPGRTVVCRCSCISRALPLPAEITLSLWRCAKPIFRFGVDNRRQQLPGNGTSN